MQKKFKRRLVYGGIAIIWILIPAYMTIVGSLGTDIIDGMCSPWRVYSSKAAEKAMITSVFIITYLLPLIMLMFSYIRIVYALKRKVGYVTYTA